jgi:hypothetical protein
MKAISNIANTSADNLSNVISQTIKRSTGQGPHLILDLTGQADASLAVAQRGVARYFGQGTSKESIRVIGNGFDHTFNKADFSKK